MVPTSDSAGPAALTSPPLPWRRNLAVCFAGSVTTIIAMTMLLPFLPAYVVQLGVTDPAQVALFAGLAYSATWLTAALTAPLWGRLGDRFGRKSMLLRASLGMAVAISLIGFVQDVWQLIALRLLVGLVGGYASGSTILVADQAPRERSAWALGVLSSGIMAGSVIGPLLGGVLPGLIGVRMTFLLSGGLIFLAFLATWFVLVDDSAARARGRRDAADRRAVLAEGGRPAGLWRTLPNRGTVIALLSLLVLVTLATLSVEPILTVYVTDLAGESFTVDPTALSGVVFALAAFGSIVSAPRLGALADRVGHLRVVTACLVAATVLLLLQALVVELWQLAVLRLLMGVALGGLIPAVTAAVRSRVPAGSVGAVLGLGVSAQYAGQVAGPVLGGLVAGWWGIPAVFLATAVVACAGAGVAWLLSRRPAA